MHLINYLSEIIRDCILNGATGAFALVFAAAAVFGLIECLFGYKIMRACFALAGFAVGGAGGIIVTALMQTDEIVMLLAALFGAILMAFLLFRIYRLGVFFLNFALWTLLFIVLGCAPAGAAVIGLLGGIIAAVLVRVICILTTGICGGMVAGFCLGAVLGSLPVGLVLGCLFAIGGTVFQFKTSAKKAKRESAEKAPAAPAVSEKPSVSTPAAEEKNISAPIEPKRSDVQPVSGVTKESAESGSDKDSSLGETLSTIGKALCCIVVCGAQIVLSYAKIAWVKLSVLLRSCVSRLYTAG